MAKVCSEVWKTTVALDERAVLQLVNDFGIPDIERLWCVLHQARDIFDSGWPDVRPEAAQLRQHLNDALALLESEWLEYALAGNDLDESEDVMEGAVTDRFDERVRAVRQLRDLAQAASQGRPVSKKGRPPETEKLRGFVAKLAAYWRDELGREFTQDFHGGQPVSGASRFVVAAAQTCGIPAKNKQLRTVMVALIATYRKSRDLS